MSTFLQLQSDSHDRAVSVLVDGIVEIQQAVDDRERRFAKDRLWPLLFSLLADLTRAHGSRFSGIDRDDLYDIVADKTLVILGKIEDREWQPSSWSNNQVRAYLSKTARHSLVDHVRTQQRARRRDERMVGSDRETESAEEVLRRRQFAAGLLACVERLRPRARAIWILRVLFEFPSKQVGRHPSVRMSPAAVDVALARGRRAIRTCMRKKNLDASSVLPGTFVAVWESFRSELVKHGGHDADRA